MLGQMFESGPSPHAGKEAVADLLSVLPVARQFGLEHAILKDRSDYHQDGSDEAGHERPQRAQEQGGTQRLKNKGYISGMPHKEGWQQRRGRRLPQWRPGHPAQDSHPGRARQGPAPFPGASLMLCRPLTE